MRAYKLILIALTLLLAVGCGRRITVVSYAIVPEPVFLVQKEGTFTISGKTQLFIDGAGQNSSTVNYIKKSLRKMDIRTSLSGVDNDNCIALVINQTRNDVIGDEGYILEVRPNGIYISANTETGIFYGFQTLIQMLPEDITKAHYSKIIMPCCVIQDYPAFEWRGSMRDVSRHFFSTKDIKKHLDLMALYKLNRFHWHLTDDHGWRIELDNYPEMNDIGSWRVDRDDQPWGKADLPREGEARTYGGFYTKDEIAKIVEYAAERHIEVIPEIEIPGHCAEILCAHPSFACANDDTTYNVEIGPYWPPRAILCGGNDSVMLFLKDVMDEIIPLFPYEYIHIGGDEAVKDNWKKCPLCQARIKELGLEGEEGLQSWMIREIEAYLKLKGKRIIGWDEILDGGVSETATVMSWRGKEGAIAAAKRGNDAIMCPIGQCYFNFYQANEKYAPVGFPGFVSLYSTYHLDIVPTELTPEEAKHVIGGQGNLWAEYVNTQDVAEYQLIPRICASAECLWTPAEKKSWNAFRAKVNRQKARLTSRGYNCGESSFKPIIKSTASGDNDCLITLDWEVEGTQIYYTLNNDTTGSGILYTQPFVVPSGTYVNTKSYLNGRLKECPYRFHIIRSKQ